MAKKSLGTKGQKKKSVWRLVLSMFSVIFLFLIVVSLFLNKSNNTTYTETEAATKIISSTGTKTALVILFNFADLTTQPFTTSAVKTSLISSSSVSIGGKTYRYSVNEYFKKSSSNRFSLSTASQVTGWYTISSKISGCTMGTPRQWADQAKSKALQAGYNADNYDIVMYVFPETRSCYPYQYNAATGHYEANTTPAGKKQVWVWLNGTASPTSIVRYVSQGIGAEAAHYISCSTGSGASVPITWKLQSCSLYNGRVFYDATGPMESLQTGQGVTAYRYTYQPDFNAKNKLTLGWISSGVQVSTPTSLNTNIKLYALDKVLSSDVVGARKFYKISKQDLSGNSYFIEYRRGVGLDATSPIAGNSGIYIWGYTTTAVPGVGANIPFLTDTIVETPSTANLSDAPLKTVGAQFYDNHTTSSTYPNGNNIRIKLLKKDDTAGEAIICIQINQSPSTACPAL